MMAAKNARKKTGTNPCLADVVPADAVKHALQGITPLLSVSKVSGSDEKEVENRIKSYFDHCQNAEVIPTVEGMALALGIDRTTLWRWEKGDGCTVDVMEIIRRSKLILQATDAELALRQKISPVTYIFRAKNFYGMTDNVRIEADVPQKRVSTLEEIARRYGDVIDIEPVQVIEMQSLDE